MQPPHHARLADGGHPEHPGLPTLNLLARKPAVRILEELAHAPLQPSELELLITDAPRSALMRQLAELHSSGAIARQRETCLPPRTHYALTDAGRSLARIAEAARHWAQLWMASKPQPDDGLHALRLLGDEHVRAILTALHGRQLRPTDLERRLPALRRTAVRTRLRQLTHLGILARIAQTTHVHYTLAPAARHLHSIAALATRWEQHQPRLR